MTAGLMRGFWRKTVIVMMPLGLAGSLSGCIEPPPRSPGRPDLWASPPARWHGDGRDYHWVRGRYVQRPARDAEWIPAEWRERNGAWVYHPGHRRHRCGAGDRSSRPGAPRRWRGGAGGASVGTV